MSSLGETEDLVLGLQNTVAQLAAQVLDLQAENAQLTTRIVAIETNQIETNNSIEGNSRVTLSTIPVKLDRFRSP